MDGRRLTPTLFERIASRSVIRFLHRIKKGSLTLIMPDGQKMVFSGPEAGLVASIRLFNYRLFSKVAVRGGIGLGESYVDGDWESAELPDAIGVILENMELSTERSVNVFWPARVAQLLRHRLLRANSLSGSRRNIQEHYDLGNHFFSQILDPSMTYSSALFQSSNDTLETAQRNKIERIMNCARIKSTDHVLEIGSGWGSFAIQAALQRRCRVTTLTLSQEQKVWVEHLIKENNLKERVQVLLCDYREVTGQFDKIVSIEMMEAIGKEYLPTFFRCCERLLTPNGIMVAQVITMLDYWYNEYCKRTDWIQKHIFPGSHLPSLSAINDTIANNTTLIIDELTNIAPHYAETLKRWRLALEQRSTALATHGYDRRFQRTFRFYLASCEAQFRTRLLNLLQIVFTRPNNRSLMAQDIALLSPTTYRASVG